MHDYSGCLKILRANQNHARRRVPETLHSEWTDSRAGPSGGGRRTLHRSERLNGFPLRRELRLGLLRD